MSEKASLFWIEPQRLASLMERLETPVEDLPTAGPSPPESPSATENPSVSTESPDIADPLDDTVSVIPSPSEGKEEKDVAPAEPFAQYQLGPGSIETRLDALLSWLKANVNPRDAFVTDREGLALAGATAPEIVAAAAQLAGTWEDVRGVCQYPEDGALSIDAPGGGRLHLLRAETRWGSLHLGFVAEQDVPSSAMSQIREAFSQTVAEKEPVS